MTAARSDAANRQSSQARPWSTEKPSAVRPETTGTTPVPPLADTEGPRRKGRRPRSNLSPALGGAARAPPPQSLAAPRACPAPASYGGEGGRGGGYASSERVVAPESPERGHAGVTRGHASCGIPAVWFTDVMWSSTVLPQYESIESREIKSRAKQERRHPRAALKDLMALLRSLVRMVPVLGRIGRPVHALSPAAGSRLMTLGRPDSAHSEELLTRQREKIERMRMDYNHTREKLTQDMDAFLELMRRDSEDSEKIFDIKEKAIHLVFIGFPLVLLMICVKYEINVLVAWGTLF